MDAVSVVRDLDKAHIGGNRKDSGSPAPGGDEKDRCAEDPRV